MPWFLLLVTFFRHACLFDNSCHNCIMLTLFFKIENRQKLVEKHIVTGMAIWSCMVRKNEISKAKRHWRPSWTILKSFFWLSCRLKLLKPHIVFQNFFRIKSQRGVIRDPCTRTHVKLVTLLSHSLTLYFNLQSYSLRLNICLYLSCSVNIAPCFWVILLVSRN